MRKLIYLFFVIIFTGGCLSKQEVRSYSNYLSKQAYVTTKMPNFSVNGYTLEQDNKSTIATGRNVVTYNGLTALKIPKQPSIDVDPKKAAGASIVTCIAVLPLCPVSMLLIQATINNVEQIETACFGELEFYAKNEESYLIKLVETADIIPKISVVLAYNDAVVSEKKVECDKLNVNKAEQNKS